MCIAKLEISPLDKDTIDALRELWLSSSFQSAWAKRVSVLSVADTAGQFLDRLDEVINLLINRCCCCCSVAS